MHVCITELLHLASHVYIQIALTVVSSHFHTVKNKSWKEIEDIFGMSGERM